MQLPRNIWQLASFAFEMGFIISLPLVILGLLGKYLDARWGTRPWLTLAGILLALVVTSVWLYRYLRSLMEFKSQPPPPLSEKLKTTTQK